MATSNPIPQDQEGLLPTYTPTGTLPPAYTTHESDRLLLTSTDPTATDEKRIFSISGDLRLKIHQPLYLLHQVLFTFLLLNTALFALLVYTLDETSFAARGVGVCSCPLQGGLKGSWCEGFMYEGMGVLGRNEYEEFEGWRRCVSEVEGVMVWREWVLWVLMPGLCIFEMLAAGGWWWCLREVERREKQTEEGKGNEEEGV
ncbi:hypothetical protein TWF481_000668 [Arthrobotrys musiformis]|uniref:Uncharacterized protein n=1 Tax=Arthrobotrys musiformis TaxID=47236 RepID=A0AAV9WN97_9PEZI